MSWWIDHVIAKADAEDQAQLEEKIEHFKKLQNSQPWPEETALEFRAIINRLETQLALYKEAA